MFERSLLAQGTIISRRIKAHIKALRPQLSQRQRDRVHKYSLWYYRRSTLFVEDAVSKAFSDYDNEGANPYV